MTHNMTTKATAINTYKLTPEVPKADAVKKLSRSFSSSSLDHRNLNTPDSPVPASSSVTQLRQKFLPSIESDDETEGEAPAAALAPGDQTVQAALTSRFNKIHNNNTIPSTESSSGTISDTLSDNGTPHTNPTTAPDHVANLTQSVSDIRAFIHGFTTHVASNKAIDSDTLAVLQDLHKLQRSTKLAVDSYAAAEKARCVQLAGIVDTFDESAFEDGLVTANVNLPTMARDLGYLDEFNYLLAIPHEAAGPRPATTAADVPLILAAARVTLAHSEKEAQALLESLHFRRLQRMLAIATSSRKTQIEAEGLKRGIAEWYLESKLRLPPPPAAVQVPDTDSEDEHDEDTESEEEDEEEKSSQNPSSSPHTNIFPPVTVPSVPPHHPMTSVITEAINTHEDREELQRLLKETTRDARAADEFVDPPLDPLEGFWDPVVVPVVVTPPREPVMESSSQGIRFYHDGSFEIIEEEEINDEEAYKPNTLGFFAPALLQGGFEVDWEGFPVLANEDEPRDEARSVLRYLSSPESSSVASYADLLALRDEPVIKESIWRTSGFTLPPTTEIPEWDLAADNNINNQITDEWAVSAMVEDVGEWDVPAKMWDEPVLKTYTDKALTTISLLKENWTRGDVAMAMREPVYGVLLDILARGQRGGIDEFLDITAPETYSVAGFQAFLSELKTALEMHRRVVDGFAPMSMIAPLPVFQDDARDLGWSKEKHVWNVSKTSDWELAAVPRIHAIMTSHRPVVGKEETYPVCDKCRERVMDECWFSVDDDAASFRKFEDRFKEKRGRVECDGCFTGAGGLRQFDGRWWSCDVSTPCPSTVSLEHS